jgi:glycosyltransferase involved in cell wall biosynthesis
MLKRLIEDPELRKKLGKAARKLAEEKSIPVVSEKALTVYKKLLKN